MAAAPTRVYLEEGKRWWEPGTASRPRAAHPAIAAMRAQVTGVLSQPSDGKPLAAKGWPARYAARRIAWHALDHAWEIEDRSEPAG